MYQSNQAFAQLSTVVPFFAPKAEGEVVFSLDRKKLQSDVMGTQAKKAAVSELIIPASTQVRAEVQGKTINFITLTDTVIPDSGTESAAVTVKAITSSSSGNVEAQTISSIGVFAYGALEAEKEKVL